MGAVVNAVVPCSLCGCIADTTATHAIAAALALNDIDRALDAGLLDDAGCAGCSSACANARATASDARATALRARARFHQRNARLDRRKAERAARRAPPPPGPIGSTPAASPVLPPAAASALARAKAKVAERQKP